MLVNCQNSKIVSFQFTLKFNIFCYLLVNFVLFEKLMGILVGFTECFPNTINFPKISGKVEKAASRKGQIKLLLLEVYTKIKEM